MSNPLRADPPKPCPECGGERIYCTVGDACALIPGKIYQKDCVPFQACICTTCGHSTLYVTEPTRLTEKPEPRKRGFWG